MNVNTEYLCIALVIISLNGLKSEMDVGDVFHLLSQKIDSVNIEMSIMRTELASFKEELQLLKQNADTDVYNGPSTSVNATAIKETILNAVGMELGGVWSSLNQTVRELEDKTLQQFKLMTEIRTTVDTNEQAYTDLDTELDLIKLDMNTLTEQHENLSQVVVSHMEQIDAVVENQDRCQTGTAGIHTYPNSQIPGKKVVEFARPFHRQPVVAWGVILVDNSRAYAVRYSIGLSNISKTGFTVNFFTWSDSIVYGLSVAWIACPS